MKLLLFFTLFLLTIHAAVSQAVPASDSVESPESTDAPDLSDPVDDGPDDSADDSLGEVTPSRSQLRANRHH